MSIAIDGAVSGPRVGAGLSKRVKAIFFAMQVAQMRRALSGMTDAQLEAIGATRSEINEKAIELLKH